METWFNSHKYTAEIGTFISFRTSYHSRCSPIFSTGTSHITTWVVFPSIRESHSLQPFDICVHNIVLFFLGFILIVVSLACIHHYLACIHLHLIINHEKYFFSMCIFFRWESKVSRNDTVLIQLQEAPPHHHTKLVSCYLMKVPVSVVNSWSSWNSKSKLQRKLEK